MQSLCYTVQFLVLLCTLVVEVNSCSTEQPAQKLRFVLLSVCPSSSGGPLAEKQSTKFGCAMRCAQVPRCNAFHFAQDAAGDGACYLGDACAPDGGSSQWTPVNGECETFSYQENGYSKTKDSAALLTELQMKLFFRFKKSGLLNEADPRRSCLTAQGVTIGNYGAEFRGPSSLFLSVETQGFEQYLNYGTFSLYAVLRAPFNEEMRSYSLFSNKTFSNNIYLTNIGGLFSNYQGQRLCLATSWVSGSSQRITGWVSTTTAAGTSDMPVEMSIGVSFNRTTVSAFYFNGSRLEVDRALPATVDAASLEQFRHLRLSTSLEGSSSNGSIRCFGFSAGLLLLKDMSRLDKYCYED